MQFQHCMNALRYWSNSKCHFSRQELSKADIENVGAAQMLYDGKQIPSKALKNDRKLSCVPAFCLVFSHFSGLWGISPLPLILTHSYTIPFLFLLGTRSCPNSFYGNLVCTFGYTLESEIWDTETFRNQGQSRLSQIVEHVILLQNPTQYTMKG